MDMAEWRNAECSDINHWLSKNGFHTRSAAAATHLDLSGGMYTVPREARRDFYTMIARDLRAAEQCPGSKRFYLCEKRPQPISPFYIDLDYTACDALSVDDSLRITVKIQAALRLCYESIDAPLWRSIGLAAILVCPEASLVVVQKRQFLKTGVHIVFPNLFVSEEQCSSLAQYCIQYLMVQLPQTSSMLPWASIIDLAVYGNGKGLRMLGASKCTRCACSKKPQADRRLCLDCGGQSVIVTGQGRIYQPAWVIEGGDTIPALNTPRFKTDSVYALSISSILCEQTRPVAGFALPTDFVPLLKRNVAALGRFLANEIPPSDIRVSILQKLVQGLRREWASIAFFKVTSSGDKYSSYTCKAFGPGSKFCQNVMREHKTSSIYFTVSKRAIVQRCYCRKAPLPGVIGCQKYSSLAEPLRDIGAMMLLFPMADAVGAQLQDSYNEALGGVWGESTGEDNRISILRRRRVLNRLSVSIPPAKRARLERAAETVDEE